MNKPPAPLPASPTPGFQFSLRSMMIVLAVLIIVIGGGYELFRLRVVSHYQNRSIRLLTPERYAPEQPVDLRPQGRQNAFPQFTTHLNSEACLERMRAEFSDFHVSQIWTQENVEFRAIGMQHVLPCQVYIRCELPVPFIRKRDLMDTRGGGGPNLLPEFEARFEKFALRELEEFCAQQTPPAQGAE